MRKQDVPKVDGFGPFLGLIYPWEPKVLPKKQSFPRNCILMTIKWHKSQVSEKSQNSYKINKKNWGGGQKWTF